MALGRFGQQARFAASRLSLKEHESRVPQLDAGNLLVEGLEFRIARDEGRFDQSPADVAGSNHDVRFGVPRGEAFLDRPEIRERRFSRLVAVSGILPQQTLDEFIERSRDFQSEGSQFGDRGCHVAEQHGVEVCPGKRRITGEAFKEHNARGIQIGGLRDVVIDRSRLFRGVILRLVQEPVGLRGLGQHQRRRTHTD